MEEKQWYSNKELFEMISDLKGELVETRRAVKEYNNIRKQLNDVCQEVAHIKSEGTGKNKMVSGAVLVVGIVGTLIGIAGGILTIAAKF